MRWNGLPASLSQNFLGFVKPFNETNGEVKYVSSRLAIAFNHRNGGFITNVGIQGDSRIFRAREEMRRRERERMLKDPDFVGYDQKFAFRAKDGRRHQDFADHGERKSVEMWLGPGEGKEFEEELEEGIKNFVKWQNDTRSFWAWYYRVEED